MIVTVEFDTEDKTLVVKKGGEVVTDVDGVSFYKSYCSDMKGKFDMSLSQCGEPVEGVTTRIYSMAKLLGLKDEN